MAFDDFNLTTSTHNAEMYIPFTTETDPGDPSEA